MAEGISTISLGSAWQEAFGKGPSSKASAGGLRYGKGERILSKEALSPKVISISVGLEVRGHPQDGLVQLQHLL